MQYRKEVDGLRAIAVIPVILFHAGFATFAGGFVGVDVFFVISGYLITGIILKEQKEGKFTILQFYERRARRILPALCFVMFCTTVLAWLWLLPNEMRRFAQSLVAVSTFSSNIFFYLTSGYFGLESKPLLHTWSLAVEEQYYVLFPLFIMLAWGLGKRKIVVILSAVAILSLLLAQWSSDKHAEWDFLLLPTRIWELLVGAFAAFYLADKSANYRIFDKWQGEVLSLLGLILIIYAVFTFNRYTPFPSLWALFPTLGACLLILFAIPETLVGKFLSLKPVVGIGLISYSAYLWHQPLFSLAGHRSVEPPAQSLLLILAVASLVLAYFSWKYVEGPFRDKTNFTRKQIFYFGAASSMGFIAFGLAGHLTSGFPNRLPANALATHIAHEYETRLLSAGCVPTPDGENFDQCIRGDKSVLPDFALIGDSHAQALEVELTRDFSSNHLSFLSYANSACPLAFNASEDIPFFFNDCREIQQRILDRVPKDNVSTYIIYSDWVGDRNGNIPDITQAVFDANKKSILQLLEYGKKVILVYPTPDYDVNVSDFMTKNNWFYGGKLGVVTVDTQIYKQQTQYIFGAYDELGSNPDLSRIYPDKIFCDTFEPGKCITQLNGELLYFDTDHLTNPGARLIVNEIMKYVRSDEQAP